jgi:hypothetical protein
MKLDDYRQEYQDFSRQASASTRQLALAGAAAAWLFIHGYEKPNGIPVSLFFSFLCLAGSLFADVLQYTAGAVIFRCFFRYHEKRLVSEDREEDLDHDPLYPSVMAVFFIAKLLLAFVGYCCLGWFIWPNLF